MNDMHKPGGLLYTVDGLSPAIDPTAWVAPTAVLIGDVRIGPGANIWFNCVLRGDTNPIIIGARSNIQDGTIIHVDHNDNPAIIGEDVTVGHGAIIHACCIHDRGFIGMGAVVLDGAEVEEAGLLAARGLLGPGKRIGKQELWMGSPAKFSRVMSDEERAGWDQTVPHYLHLASLYRQTLRQAG